MPLVMRYPKAIKAGSVTSAIAMNIDFGPTFLDFAALCAYQKHPLHVAIADGLVRPVMAQRLSFDYDA